MGGYDNWLDSPYREAEGLELATEKALEETKWNITNALREGTPQDAWRLVYDSCDEESYTVLARLLYEYSRNLSNAANPEFARLVVRLLEEVVTKIACQRNGIDYQNDHWAD